MAALFYPFAKELSVVATPGFHKAIKLLSNWMQRDEWRAEFLSVLEDHIDPACEEFNVAMEYLEDEIGWEFAEMATACAVEDFFTAVYEPGGRNLIEDYLKRRGWKESAPVKNCLHALRHSVASLYEVADTVPKSHIFVRDLVRGGEPIRLDDREMASLVVKWDRFAMRLMNIRGKFHATTTVLDFPIEESDELLAELRKYVALAYETPGEEDRAQDANPAETRRMMEEATLRDAAPLITDYWLRGIFRMLGRPFRQFRGSRSAVRRGAVPDNRRRPTGGGAGAGRDRGTGAGRSRGTVVAMDWRQFRGAARKSRQSDLHRVFQRIRRGHPGHGGDKRERGGSNRQFPGTHRTRHRDAGREAGWSSGAAACRISGYRGCARRRGCFQELDGGTAPVARGTMRNHA
jgi:hypothetical protein